MRKVKNTNGSNLRQYKIAIVRTTNKKAIIQATLK